jgi:group I intron endonuclease
MFIYLITNHITGKVYIGQHKGDNLQHYLQQKFYEASHRLKNRSHLYASMRKHGRDAFSIRPLVSGIQTREELNQKEKEFIELYDSRNHEKGYNICRGGEGFSGPHTPKAKAKVTKALKERWKQPGFKKYWSSIMTGHPTSPETIEKIKAKRADQDESSRIAGVRKYAKENQEEMRTRMSHEVHVLGGKAGSRENKQRAAAASIASGSHIKARHVRWHVNRGLKNPECRLCAS